MTDYVFPPAAAASVAVAGRAVRFPVHRIYCVGRNFAEHAREMGAEPPPRGQPVFFMKPADAVHGEDAGDVPYPSGTSDLHHEVELVVALGRDADGVVDPAHALDVVFGYTVGIDLTRRDLQAIAKDKRLPWDTAKGFDHSAPVGALVRASAVPTGELWLRVNDAERQRAPLADMVFGVAEIVHELSKLFALRAGDLVFMGTPAGVAALQPGDSFEAGIEGFARLVGRIGSPTS
jgi:2-keto-4-pentenoate hydratase/2-oxohepta-3-ene-1,7-dioic acid hydratase in catechol pathway